MMMDIFSWGSDSLRGRLARIRERLLDFDEITARPSYRETCRRVFGRVLTPPEAVRAVIEDVRREGDAALLRYTAAFDGVELSREEIAVPGEEIAGAPAALDAGLREALETAVERVRSYQEALLASRETPGGGSCTRKRVPVERAGVYVPGGTGGTTPLVSCVYMNAVPAAAAGVEEIVMCTPPGEGGAVRTEILAAAALCGVKRVYRVGGAQAVAAMAWGTETVPGVDVVAGPGNLFVTLAKKEVLGRVGIDLLAGPSEICVIADRSVPPEIAAADLLSQAEHDPLASAVLLTPEKAVAEAVAEHLQRRLEALPRRETAEAALREYGALVVTASLEEAVRAANELAPEHLEILTERPEELLPLVKNAGAVFLGRFSPEACGDYIAGPSHTLPTGGTARFFSGLSAETFTRSISVVNMEEGEFERLAPLARRIAEAEGLDAHARSLSVRLEE